MNYEQAQRRAVALAEKGDIEGIDALIEEASKSGIHPTLVFLLSTFKEKAALNLGGNKPKRQL